jgi:hypothetical protein
MIRVKFPSSNIWLSPKYSESRVFRSPIISRFFWTTLWDSKEKNLWGWKCSLYNRTRCWIDIFSNKQIHPHIQQQKIQCINQLIWRWSVVYSLVQILSRLNIVLLSAFCFYFLVIFHWIKSPAIETSQVISLRLILYTSMCKNTNHIIYRWHFSLTYSIWLLAWTEIPFMFMNWILWFDDRKKIIDESSNRGIHSKCHTIIYDSSHFVVPRPLGSWKMEIFMWVYMP